MHVLVVDDDPLTRRMLTRLLVRDFGVTTTEAGNGLQALELLQRERYDLALIDLDMPVLDGSGLLAAIRDSDALRTLPVIVLSGVREADRVRRVVAAGVSDYLTKPIRLDTTGVRLARYFERCGHPTGVRYRGASLPVIPEPDADRGEPAAASDGFRVRPGDIAAGIEQAFGLLAAIELTTHRDDMPGVSEPALTSAVRIDAAEGATMAIELRLSAPAALQLAHLAGGDTVEAAQVVLWDLTSTVAGRLVRLLLARGQTATAGAVTVEATPLRAEVADPTLRLRFTTAEGDTVAECLVDVAGSNRR